jgi:hypothetical protein
MPENQASGETPNPNPRQCECSHNFNAHRLKYIPTHNLDCDIPYICKECECSAYKPKHSNSAHYVSDQIAEGPQCQVCGAIMTKVEKGWECKSCGETRVKVTIQKEPQDYPSLREQINDRVSVFYGPHECGNCTELIIRQELDKGGVKYQFIYGKGWQIHTCQPKALPFKADTLLNVFAEGKGEMIAQTFPSGIPWDAFQRIADYCNTTSGAATRETRGTPPAAKSLASESVALIKAMFGLKDIPLSDELCELLLHILEEDFAKALRVSQPVAPPTPLTFTVDYDFLHSLWQALGQVPQGVDNYALGVYEKCRKAFQSLEDLFNAEPATCKHESGYRYGEGRICAECGKEFPTHAAESVAPGASAELSFGEDQTGTPSIFWNNPWTKEREAICKFTWPIHPPEVTEQVEKLWDAFGKAFAAVRITERRAAAPAGTQPAQATQIKGDDNDNTAD